MDLKMVQNGRHGEKYDVSKKLDSTLGNKGDVSFKATNMG